MRKSHRAIRWLAGALLVAGAAVVVRVAPEDRTMGSYVTSLAGRTRGQRRNALLAARRIDGVVIEAGSVFSFDRAVGPWSPDRGYVVAPVSYDGQIVADWGGGVCQTSTTLYNAALLAGLDVVERHRHTWAPKYVPPGRDAAVAQCEIDLRLRNPYPWPVRIRSRSGDESVGFEIRGRIRGPIAAIRSEPTASAAPIEIDLSGGRGSGRRVVTHGRPGARVAVYRTIVRGPRAGIREVVSLDSYPAMNRVMIGWDDIR